ncbi:MAG TPA: alpha/beta hydrolase [Terriglobales bacterium]|nr:alpha/beta hydrolase [Terriglobales bacterium]
MKKVISLDGTAIAYDVTGSGPPLILIDGALCSRNFGPMPELAQLLAPYFTVYTYDRRGRGDSGDTLPYSIEREIEDIHALIQQAGGSAFVYGISSGAALALEAANRLAGITKVVAYEAPFVVDSTYPPMAEDYLPRLITMVAENRRSDALKHFMRRVGMPSLMLAFMQFTPAWPKLKRVAHTLVYDITIVERNQRGRPLRPAQWEFVSVPVLVAAGGKSAAWMQNGARALADAIPTAKHLTVPGQNHMLKASAILPVLKEFFLSASSKAAVAQGVA